MELNQDSAATPEPVYTPPAIKGYRKLTQAELDTVNQIKQLGAFIEGEMKVYANSHPGHDKRCAALAATNLQQGLMWLTRSITKPETFA